MAVSGCVCDFSSVALLFGSEEQSRCDLGDSLRARHTEMSRVDIAILYANGYRIGAKLFYATNAVSVRTTRIRKEQARGRIVLSSPYFSTLLFGSKEIGSSFSGIRLVLRYLPDGRNFSGKCLNRRNAHRESIWAEHILA